MRHLLPALAVLTAALSAHAQYGPAGGAASAAPTLKVATPTRGDLHRFVAQPGTIRPLQDNYRSARELVAFEQALGIGRSGILQEDDVFAGDGLRFDEGF